MYSIYKLNKNFTVKTEDFDKIKYSSDDIDDILEKLEEDQGYCIRINPEKECIVFGDFDHLEKENEKLFSEFLKLLEEVFAVSNNKISFTLSKKEKELSFHFSIPSLKSNCAYLKYIFGLELFEKYKKYIDLSIYSKKWFRLPNQTNEEKPYSHAILHGRMTDFIIEYLDNATKKITGKIPTDEDESDDEEKTEESNDSHNITQNDNKREDIQKLLNCLNESRYTYEDWLNVGIVIYNETNDKSLWKEWSKKYNKYDEKEINYKWTTFNKNTVKKLTIATLHKYAKEDNEELYKTYFKRERKCEIKDFEIFNNTLTTFAIATQFKNMYSNKFIYQNEKLYCYNGVYWKPESKDELTTLNMFICTVFYEDLKKLFRQYEDYQHKKENVDKEQLNKKLQDIYAYINNLLNNKARKNVIADIIFTLTNNDIKFDEMPCLFAFNNAIYDLTRKCFIDPKPEFYISITCGYDYIEKDETENKKAVNDLINSIFSEKEIRDLYLTILSSGMDAKPLERFVIANGSGGNGKGVVNDLFDYMLGNYAYLLPVNILMGPLKTGSNPEVANLNKKRFVRCREPDDAYKMNCSTIKELTGGDSINARLNYSNDTKTEVCMSFVIECNKKPFLSEANDAMMRRIIDIPFKNRFVDENIYKTLDDDEKKNTYMTNCYLKTQEFKEKHKHALFFILAEYYYNFHVNNRNLIIPDEIKKRNVEYLENSDEMFCWFNDKYEKTVKTDNIKLKTVYTNFTRSEYFSNLNKADKRKNNYKNFVKKLSENMFLKKYVVKDIHEVYMLTGHKLIEDDVNEE